MNVAGSRRRAKFPAIPGYWEEARDEGNTGDGDAGQLWGMPYGDRYIRHIWQARGREYLQGKRNADSGRKPGWCPLVPMPGRKKETYDVLKRNSAGEWEKYAEQTDRFAAGWNACIDAAEGGKG